MTRYAEHTNVSSDKSRAEIEKTLSRYGATSFLYGWMDAKAVLGFEMRDRRVKFVLPMPDRSGLTRTPTGRVRKPTAVDHEFEQAVKQRWRALALVIKAKLEAVESGITEFEEEFLAHIVMPDGQTVGEKLLPNIESAYKTGDLPPLLLGH